MPALHDFFANKTVVITGAASGIGKALATLFADLGCKVAICDIDEGALSNVAVKLQSAHPGMTLFKSFLDVSSKTDWEIFLDGAFGYCKHIDIVINNAGIEGSAQPVWASDDELLKRVMDV
ncbi:MAG: NAD(P)-dependent dehydrogenase (short-subunit alcohol dehydrogenase family), partial [Glaciecola sp.]